MAEVNNNARGLLRNSFKQLLMILLTDHYNQLFKQAESKILKESDEFILGTSTDELTRYFYADFEIKPVEVDTSREVTLQHTKSIRTIPASHREGPFQGLGDLEREFESITIRVPIKNIEDAHTFRQLRNNISTSSWTLDGINWNGDDILSFSFDTKGYGFNKTDEEIERQIQNEKERVFGWMYCTGENVRKGNVELYNRIKSTIEARKQKLEEDKERIAALVKRINIPLYKKENEFVRKIQLNKKPLVEKIRPVPHLEEYVLDREKVLDIIQFLDNQGRQFEKTPHSFQNSGETDLRNNLLVMLNSIFDGKATGETFQTKGKTDIYLNIDKGSILAFECKFWAGASGYLETICQILGYLTWRDNFGVIINFVKRKNFEGMLEEARKTTEEHPTFRQTYQKINVTHFFTKHVLPTDEHKNVELHHIFYNLYVGE